MKKMPGPARQFALTLLLFLSVIPAVHAESSATPVCRADDNPAFALRKSITVLNIAVENPQVAADMPDLGTAVAKHLGQALQQRGEMRVRDGSNHAFDSSRLTLLGLVDTRLNAQLTHLGRELNSQLIVSGRITDLSVTPRSNIMSRMLGYVLPRLGDSRIFALELTVYDSYSGTELLRKPYQTQASGTINMLGMQPLKGRFLDTDYGRAVSTLLDNTALDLQNALSCIPMMTTIAHIEGTTVQIKEGNESLLRPGDRLRLFHRQPAGIDKLGNEQFIEEYVSDAYASRIFPDSAILELKDAKAASRLRQGDIARAW